MALDSFVQQNLHIGLVSWCVRDRLLFAEGYDAAFLEEGEGDSGWHRDRIVERCRLLVSGSRRAGDLRRVIGDRILQEGGGPSINWVSPPIAVT